jgi:hypothetical protein
MNILNLLIYAFAAWAFYTYVYLPRMEASAFTFLEEEVASGGVAVSIPLPAAAPVVAELVATGAIPPISSAAAVTQVVGELIAAGAVAPIETPAAATKVVSELVQTGVIAPVASAAIASQMVVDLVATSAVVAPASVTSAVLAPASGMIRAAPDVIMAEKITSPELVKCPVCDHTKCGNVACPKCNIGPSIGLRHYGKDKNVRNLVNEVNAMLNTARSLQCTANKQKMLDSVKDYVKMSKNQKAVKCNASLFAPLMANANVPPQITQNIDQIAKVVCKMVVATPDDLKKNKKLSEGDVNPERAAKFMILVINALCPGSSLKAAKKKAPVASVVKKAGKASVVKKAPVASVASVLKKAGKASVASVASVLKKMAAPKKKN